jgi:hypothetical protein
MSKYQNPVATTASKSNHGKDYAALIDREGREHLITRDMVDTMIDELVSGPDYSLQGSDRHARGAAEFQVLTNSPPLG